MAKAKQKSVNDFYMNLFNLIEQRGWFDLTLPDIAKATKTKLPELLKTYSDKTSILTAFGHMLDEKLAEVELDDAPLKDKLFDMFMRRFDALAPYRKGAIRLIEEMPRQPFSTLLLGFEAGCGFTRSMMFILEMAGLSSAKPFHLLAATGLKLVYFSALRAWMHDESTDLSATMAALDRGLDRWLKLTRLG